MNIKKLRDEIWRFVQKQQRGYPKDIIVKKKDIDELVFKCEGEYRISGEISNNFSSLYVNYDNIRESVSLVEHLQGHGWDIDWYNHAYIVAVQREDKRPIVTKIKTKTLTQIRESENVCKVTE